MIKLYKLTTEDNKTRKGFNNECEWGPGVSHSGTGRGVLCSPAYIHAYLSPALAVLLNPVHANIPNPRLWECSATAIAATDNDLKVGVVTLTTEREIEAPRVTTKQRVVFALLCAEKAQEIAAPFFTGDKAWQITYRAKIGEFNRWKADYLAGKGRKNKNAAEAAAYAARAAAFAADVEAAYAATRAARAAAEAATRAAYAAFAADVEAAYAAARAADAAADAAYARTKADIKIDFVELADKALRM